MIIPQRHLQGNWIYVNLFGLLLGLIIGHCIILFNTLFTGNPIELEQSGIVLLFSVLISLSIANTVSLLTPKLQHCFNNIRLEVIGFYVLCIGGTALGTGLSFGILYAFFHLAYSGWAYMEMLGINAFITLVVCTCMLLYEWQKSRFQLSSLKQEIEFIKLKRLKKKAQLQTIHAKVDPHFLYNSLNTIASLIPDDGEKAEAMTLKLAQLYRYSTSQARQNFSTIREELHIIENFMAIEQVRFGERLDFELKCHPALFDLSIPRFLLQPLLENAVKHGLSADTDQAFVKLKISRDKDQINIKIYDSGSNFPAEINCGYGLKSTYDKLKLLYQSNYQISLINVPEKHIAILLPVLSMAEIIEI